MKNNVIIELHIEGSKYDGDIIALEIETNILWNTFELTGNGCNRIRGIAIEKVDYLK